LLSNILEELTLIKREITGVKTLIQEHIGTKPAEDPVQDIPKAERPENIILAGDELADILNSAEFAEDPEVPVPGGGAAPLPENSKGMEPQTRQKTETGAPSDSVKKNAEDLLIDDLLIETGSIKDIPIELNSDEDEDPDSLYDEGPEEPENGDLVEIPLTLFDEEEQGFSGEEIFGEASLDISALILPDEEIDISDEELDRLERNILMEFSEKLPVSVEECLGAAQKNSRIPLPAEEGKKKRFPKPLSP
jgi:hypothetical protein